MPSDRTPRRLGSWPARRFVGALLALLVAAPAAAELRKASLGDGAWAVLENSSQLFVEAQSRPGETLAGFAKRLSGRSDAAARIARANAGTTKLRPGPRYRVPVELLRGDLRAKALRALFPADHVDSRGWRHRARGEALWNVALWFTGRGENFPALRRENRMRDDDLRWGQVVVVPAALLAPELRPVVAANASGENKPEKKKLRVEEARSTAVAQKEAVGVAAPLIASRSEVGPARPEPATDARPPRTPPESEVGSPRPGSLPSTRTDAAAPETAINVPQRSPEEVLGPPAPVTLSAAPASEAAAVPAIAAAVPAPPGELGSTHRLTYGRDAQGEYAVYALRGGEALYSSVVVRFTGRTLADDVNSLAIEIARRSGIDDVTSIPVGYEVKIPLDLLQPEFLPPGNPRRLEYEAAQKATSKFRNEVTALDLEGITVVLDAGHGGVDTGAMFGGVWESTYVYDIVLRVQHLLEVATAARVIPTTRDGGAFRIEDRDVLSFSRGRRVLTSPPYPIEDSKVGVNLRWYLANSVERASVRRGASSEKVVFISVHADSLHPSLRGAMVYVPDAEMSGDAFERGGPEYAARREVRENPSAALQRKERQRSEGLSRDLAEHIVAGFRDAQLAVDPYQPVREHVIRRGRSWVPAVLRYNVVPAKVLVEVCNLGNPDDRALIQTRAFRQKVAEAIVRGLRGYYGKSHPVVPPSTEQIAKATAKR
ncbi:MAG: N-acetylmuramoyl-L-alanine amidase family protein [Acidobacteriota bacterium]